MNPLIRFFMEGGPIFMGLLTIMLGIIIILSVIAVSLLISKKAAGLPSFRQRLVYIKSLGLFTMILGVLGQLMGLTEAFGAIQLASDVSPAIVAGGLKVSMYTTLYGIVIYLITILIWLGLDNWYNRISREAT